MRFQKEVSDLKFLTKMYLKTGNRTGMAFIIVSDYILQPVSITLTQKSQSVVKIKLHIRKSRLLKSKIVYIFNIILVLG